MDEAKLHEIRQWLIKADHALRSAERLLTVTPPLFDTAVYHCQQAAEKALKAYLTLQDSPFQKIHVLSTLIEQCLVFDHSFESIRDVADILTPYATAFRYPGDVLEPEPADAEEAYRLANHVFEFIAQKMPEEGRSEK